MTMVGMLGLFYISTFIDLSDKWFKGQTTFGHDCRSSCGGRRRSSCPTSSPSRCCWRRWSPSACSTKNSELIVMRACGVSLYRTAVPMLAFALVASAVLFGMEERVLAVANRRADQLKHLIRGGSPQTFDVLNRKWIVGRDGEVYHYQFYDPRTARAERPVGLRLRRRRHQLSLRVYAQRAIYQADADGSRWQMNSGWTRDVRQEERGPTLHALRGHTDALEPADYFVTEVPEPRRMNYRAAAPLHRGAAWQRLRRARARGRAAPQGRVPVRDAGDDVHRGAVRRHHRPARRDVRHRHRHRAGARLLDDDQRVRGLWRRRPDQSDAGGVGAEPALRAAAAYLLLTVRT